MKHSFPYLFPIKGGKKNDVTDRATVAVMPFCPDKIHAADDRRTVIDNKNSSLTSIEAVLTAILILEIIRSPRWQERHLGASSKPVIEERPSLKNNRYYKAWRRRELLKNNSILTS
jgi:hypothetical protein